MTIQERLSNIESNLKTYQEFINSTAPSRDERNLVSFKVLYELMAFSALREFAPEYKPQSETEFSLATGLKNVNSLVSVVEGKVIISSDYQSILQQKAEFLKKQNLS